LPRERDAGKGISNTGNGLCKGKRGTYKMSSKTSSKPALAPSSLQTLTVKLSGMCKLVVRHGASLKLK
jgi:hypothetical protein